MKFLVSRTSDSDSEAEPCGGAVAESVTTFVQMLDGTKGYVQKKKKWVVEIDDLNQLLAFIKKYDDIVLMKADCEEYPYEIEIYDNYRE